MKADTLLETIDQLVRPITKELNYKTYHIEYVRKDGEYYLRTYINKDGGIALSDCEASSRRIDDVMDEKGPTKEAYFLGISSPGLNRTLFTDGHFKKQTGKETMVRFTKSLNGRENIKGILKEVGNNSVIVETGDLITVPRDKIKSTNLEGET